MSKPLTEDEYFAGVGRIIHYYQLTENCMMAAYAHLSCIRANFSHVARGVFYAIDSLNGRRTLLNRVLTARGGLDWERTFVDKIIRQCEKANAIRRQYAHVHILPAERHGGIVQCFFRDVATWNDGAAPMKPVSRKALETAVAAVKACFDDANAAVGELYEHSLLEQQKRRARRGRGSPKASRRRKTPEPAPEAGDPRPEGTSGSG